VGMTAARGRDGGKEEGLHFLVIQGNVESVSTMLYCALTPRSRGSVSFGNFHGFIPSNIDPN
jgi:hypothetical protein